MPEPEGTAVSRKQQKLMGAVTKCQTTRKCPSPKIRRLSKIMDRDEVLSLARTKHDKLPEKFYEMVKEEIAKFLKENGAVPCGKCGKQCPCEEGCEKPTPTGFIINGQPIQMGLPQEKSMPTHCKCGVNGHLKLDTPQSEKTPLMPPDAVTQFGNTPKMNDSEGSESVPSFPDLNNDGHKEKLLKILKLLKTKTQEPAEYNGTSVTLYKPQIQNDDITFYIKRKNEVKECKIKKNT